MSGDRLHGYTVAQLDQLAQRAARACWSRYLPFSERVANARSAIAEHLCSSSSRPEPNELVIMGAQAAGVESEQMLRGHGYRFGSDRIGSRFERYWAFARLPTAPVEERLVEVMALSQIWPQLTPSMRATLVALAVHGDPRSAADAVGLTYGSFKTTLYRARRRFYSLWLDPETPTGKWDIDAPRRGGKRESQRSVTSATVRRRKRRRG